MPHRILRVHSSKVQQFAGDSLILHNSLAIGVATQLECNKTENTTMHIENMDSPSLTSLEKKRLSASFGARLRFC
ncbi:Hypothetical predicted protein [Octopus vulgaris]|uniref:Uncharacterized protein n=1 Tax=Octopus vulgaris TaxID=6645 RepID=A0AA36BC54_OCTVU|nr:Hypothetical predicted protein [Octopus vulgaris]